MSLLFNLRAVQPYSNQAKLHLFVCLSARSIYFSRAYLLIWELCSVSDASSLRAYTGTGSGSSSRDSYLRMHTGLQSQTQEDQHIQDHSTAVTNTGPTPTHTRPQHCSHKHRTHTNTYKTTALQSHTHRTNTNTNTYRTTVLQSQTQDPHQHQHQHIQDHSTAEDQ